jgi:hypothetical protein
VENYDPLGAAGYWRRGELGPRAWARSLRAVDETAWLARDDWRPFGLMCLRMGWRAISRRAAGHTHTRGPFALLRAADGPRYRPGPRPAGPRPAGSTWPQLRPGSGRAEFDKEGERV